MDIESARVCPEFCDHPESSSKEHFRDIDFLGPITLHKLAVLFWLAGSTYGLLYLQTFVWQPTTDPDVGWILLGIVWLIPLPSIVAFIIGILWFYYPTKLDKVKRTHHRVAFRIVSRGINPECLLSTIRSCQEEMKRNPLFPYLIEVVTDGDCYDAPLDVDVLPLRVPNSYQTSCGSKFKARALHYACEHTLVPPNTWIIHLDEESHPTSSCIKGVANMVTKCEDKGDLRRIGQGLILYHRGWAANPILTLADMRRTGDDVGHFYLQHRLGYTLFGLHGSYVVCRQDAEAAIGFDVGPKGSITEDAWWVLLAIENGYRTMWCEGYMSEQSTQSLSDFIRQRRRWYVGLLKVGLYCPVSLRIKSLVV